MTQPPEVFPTEWVRALESAAVAIRESFPQWRREGGLQNTTSCLLLFSRSAVVVELPESWYDFAANQGEYLMATIFGGEVRLPVPESREDDMFDELEPRRTSLEVDVEYFETWYFPAVTDERRNLIWKRYLLFERNRPAIFEQLYRTSV